MDAILDTKSIKVEESIRPEAAIQLSKFIEITKTNTDEKIKGFIVNPDWLLNKNEITIKGKNDKFVSINDEALSKIKRSIVFDKKNPEELIDCTFFAAMASGTTNLKTRREFNNDEDYANFYGTKYDWASFIEPNIGQMIVIGNRDKYKRYEFKAQHYAVYLGAGLYISKFHDKSPIVVTDLENMKQWFHTDVSFMANPKTLRRQPLYQDTTSMF